MDENEAKHTLAKPETPEMKDHDEMEKIAQKAEPETIGGEGASLIAESENIDKKQKMENLEKQFQIEETPEEIPETQGEVERAPEEEKKIKETNENVPTLSAKCKKEFLGGYRDPHTGVEYHHAVVQTESELPKDLIKFHRDTQTAQTRTCSIQTNREFGTQMPRKDHIIDDSKDKTIESRPYFSADELDELKKEKIVAIQCFARQYFARKKSRTLLIEKEKNGKNIENQLENMGREKTKKIEKFEQQHKIPKTKQDFQLLEKEIEEWRQEEAQFLNDLDLTPRTHTQQMKELLQKEIVKVRRVEQKRISAQKQQKKKQKYSQLYKMSQSKTWSLKNSKENVNVDTLFTQRSRELAMLYQALEAKSCETERREMLTKVLNFANPFGAVAFVKEMVDLIIRELDALGRQRPAHSLVGCRRRICTLFWQFITTPECNPEASRFQKIPCNVDELYDYAKTVCEM